jgi:1,4-dihydroxy-6-naphthoate synthase
MQTQLTLAHSPDPDDAFMFYGLAKNLIPTHGFHFQHVLQDIQTLNDRATRGELDITAISIAAYPSVSDHYALLPSGASMGDGYGPMLVAKKKFSRAEILKKKIAVPGTLTSAFLALPPAICRLIRGGLRRVLGGRLRARFSAGPRAAGF